MSHDRHSMSAGQIVERRKPREEEESRLRRCKSHCVSISNKKSGPVRQARLLVWPARLFSAGAPGQKRVIKVLATRSNPACPLERRREAAAVVSLLLVVKEVVDGEGRRGLVNEVKPEHMMHGPVPNTAYSRDQHDLLLQRHHNTTSC